LALSALQLAEQQLGARPLLRYRYSLEVGQRPVNLFDGRLDLASGGQQHAAAASGHRQHPCPVALTPVAFEHVDEPLGFIQPSEDHQRLNCVGQVARCVQLRIRNGVERGQKRLQHS
jgi:hypothetical protein